MKEKQIKAEYFNWQKIDWRYFHSIKKKAVEQEFSWSGLALVLSIAFFIVIISAQGLNLIYRLIESPKVPISSEQRIYRLEKYDQLNIEVIKQNLENIDGSFTRLA